MNILIVDDDPVSRKKMNRILEGAGTCEFVESGVDALMAFTAAWNDKVFYDLITLDISMPQMSGIELLKKIRKLEVVKNMPKQKRAKIIMVTASNNQEQVKECIKAGCNGYIVKPFNKESVFKRINQLNFKR